MGGKGFIHVREVRTLVSCLKTVAAARELRDRYLEQFNAGRVVGNGKYDVARALPASVPAQLQLPQAA